MSNYYIDNYSGTGKTIFELEKEVINKLNDYNDAHFKLGTCKYIVQNIADGSLNHSARTLNTPINANISQVFTDRNCGDATYTYTRNSSAVASPYYDVTSNDLNTKYTDLQNAVTDLDNAMNTGPMSNDIYDGSMSHIRTLMEQINKTRGEYDPKLEEIIKNSDRSISQQSVDAVAYTGIILSIGLASLLFFTFTRSG